MRTTLKIFLMVAVATSVLGRCFAEARDAANYVGPKTCGICHKSDEGGNQLAKWQASPHAKAFELLGTPEAKAAGAKVGRNDPCPCGSGKKYKKCCGKAA